jgi:ATP-dependent NAD(P)H-hydrate dehydratase
MQRYAQMALSMACSQGMFVVLDADALLMVGQNASVIKGYRRAVLTPNIMEFKRLSDSLSIDPDTPADKMAGLVSKALGGVTIVQKGAKDIIAVDTTGEAADPNKSGVGGGEKELINEKLEIDTKGGYRRCGGQGDILSGTVGTILAWGKCYEEGAFGYGSNLWMNDSLLIGCTSSNHSVVTSRIPMLAAAGGCMVTRTASRIAFQIQGRALVTQDMIPELGVAFREVFGDTVQYGEGGRL